MFQKVKNVIDQEVDKKQEGENHDERKQYTLCEIKYLETIELLFWYSTMKIHSCELYLCVILNSLLMYFFIQVQH